MTHAERLKELVKRVLKYDNADFYAWYNPKFGGNFDVKKHVDMLEAYQINHPIIISLQFKLDKLTTAADNMAAALEESKRIMKTALMHSGSRVTIHAIRAMQLEASAMQALQQYNQMKAGK